MASRSVKALRERYGTSGNKSDRSDTYMLADCLRTDGHRWASLQPDSPATVTLRARRARPQRPCRASSRRGEPAPRTPQARLPRRGRVVLRHRQPDIAYEFLERFPSATRGQWLSEKRLAAWLHANGYCGRRDPANLYRHLVDGACWRARRRGRRPQCGHAGPHRSPQDHRHGDQADATLDSRRSSPLTPTPKSSHRCQGTRRHDPRHYPPRRDRRLSSPVPRTRSSRLPRRGRPIHTRLSGRHRAVTFRWSSNKKLRDVICDFAGDTRNGNEWARERYLQASSRPQDTPARRTDPRTNLDAHHLALLARPHPLRPRTPRRSSTTPTNQGLT